MEHLDGPTLDWLMAGGAALRRLTFTRLLGLPPDAASVVSLGRQLTSDPLGSGGC